MTILSKIWDNALLHNLVPSFFYRILIPNGWDKNIFFETPVFIVGSGRSGTTALYNALNQHSNITMIGNESPIIHHVGELVYEYSSGSFADYYTDSIHMPKGVFFNNLRNLLIKSIFGVDLGLRHHVALQYKNEKKILKIGMWGTKAFPDEHSYLGLKILYPKAKFIYIHRSGVEVVHSMTKFKGFQERGFFNLCDLWAESVSKYRYLLSKKDAIEIRHEDLVNKPHNVISRIVNFLNLPEDNSVVNYLEGHVVHPLDKPNTQGKIKDILQKRKDPSVSWSKEQKQYFKEHCEKHMLELNYKMTI